MTIPTQIPAELAPSASGSFLADLIARISDENETTHALIRVTPEQAEVDLGRVLAARRDGRPLPLDGTTFVVKDNIDVAGVPSTLGSRHFGDRVPMMDADVVRRVRRAGGVLVGLANLHELAFGGTSENPHFGTVRNPWAGDRNAGGSSGGSTVAVALDWAALALGTDTGGSVRCPAAIAGVTGLRPTFGAVSTSGVVPLAPSFDTVGIVTRLAADAGRLLDIAADPALAATASGPLRIGLPTDPYFTVGTDGSIAEAVYRAAGVLESAGHTFRGIRVPDPESADRVARMVVRAEAWHEYGAQSEASSGNFGRDVLDRLQLGKAITATELDDLYKQRRDLSARIDVLFDEVDAILLPTVPHAPQSLRPDDPLASTEQNLAFTYLWGLGGLPAISLPCGFDNLGLPVGMQLVTRRWADRLLCELGAQFQERTDWHTLRPVDRREES